MTQPALPASALTPTQQATLRAVADTALPAFPERGETAFWRTAASDLGVHYALEQYLNTQLAPQARAGILSLLDALSLLSFAAQGQAVRESLLRTAGGISPEAAAGIGALRQLSLMFGYSMTDDQGKNPLWEGLKYAGFDSPAPSATATITPYIPQANETLEADVVVVGSGAGGGVIAARLAQAGKKVIVLEAGGYSHEGHFRGQELAAYQTLYYRGGYHPSADGNVTLVAGRNLGGGTTVNWSNSVRPRDDVRQKWATEHGLSDVADASYDAHIDSVLSRIKANEECSDHNGPHQRLQEGAQKLGYHYVRASLNIDPACYDAQKAGHSGFGDQTGAKQGTLRTFLQDAFEAGANILVATTAQQILVEEGRAAGVSATCTVDGEARPITVRARQVVVACGALETPALLLRSGLGGPATGNYLRLHPAGMAAGVYAEDQKAWWGPAQVGILKEFASRDAGHGYIIEGVQYAPGLMASGLPWQSGAAHRDLMDKFHRMSVFVSIVQDRGHGQVTVDENGQAVHTYALTDPVDVENFHQGIATSIRLHEAAGAEEIIALVPGLAPWKRGDDLEAFIAATRKAPLGAGGQTIFSAHQMGSARMGQDPQTSVADPNGQLHDTPGVWIGDTSAFPTCSGVNPMVSCMSLASRTAERLLRAMDSGVSSLAASQMTPSQSASTSQ